MTKVQEWGDPVHDWMVEQIRRHGVCRYVFTKIPFNAAAYSVYDAHTTEIVSTGHSLGVAKARANALNAKEAEPEIEDYLLKQWEANGGWSRDRS